MIVFAFGHNFAIAQFVPSTNEHVWWLCEQRMIRSAEKWGGEGCGGEGGERMWYSQSLSIKDGAQTKISPRSPFSSTLNTQHTHTLHRNRQMKWAFIKAFLPTESALSLSLFSYFLCLAWSVSIPMLDIDWYDGDGSQSEMKWKMLIKFFRIE